MQEEKSRSDVTNRRKRLKKLDYMVAYEKLRLTKHVGIDVPLRVRKNRDKTIISELKKAGVIVQQVADVVHDASCKVAAADRLADEQLADDNHTSEQLADDNHTVEQLADDNHTAEQLADDNHTAEQLADDNHTVEQLADDNRAAEQLADDNHTAEQLADDNGAADVAVDGKPANETLVGDTVADEKSINETCVAAVADTAADEPCCIKKEEITDDKPYICPMNVEDSRDDLRDVLNGKRKSAPEFRSSSSTAYGKRQKVASAEHLPNFRQTLQHSNAPHGGASRPLLPTPPLDERIFAVDHHAADVSHAPHGKPHFEQPHPADVSHAPHGELDFGQPHPADVSHAIYRDEDFRQPHPADVSRAVHGDQDFRQPYLADVSRAPHEPPADNHIFQQRPTNMERNQMFQTSNEASDNQRQPFNQSENHQFFQGRPFNRERRKSYSFQDRPLNYEGNAPSLNQTTDHKLFQGRWVALSEESRPRGQWAPHNQPRGQWAPHNQPHGQRAPYNQSRDQWAPGSPFSHCSTNIRGFSPVPNRQTHKPHRNRRQFMY